jgi:exodeoxyribonuclease V gamma subunit
VPSKGVERWIAQSLSTRLGTQPDLSDGVCANVVFPSPGRLVRDALSAGTGIPADEDPWAEHRLAWSVLEVVDGCAGEPWCLTLGRHLGLVEGGVDQGRRMAVAQKLAALFGSYAAERPSMLLAWLAGQDTDGRDHPLDPDHAWQAELWRRVRDHIGVESLAERLAPATDRLRHEPGLVDLPERFSLFGPTRLTTDQLRVLDALAARRDVHLWLPHPSHGLWRRLAEASAGGDARITTRREDATAALPEHPLVRSLGRDARELEIRLRAHTTITDDEHVPAQVGAETLSCNATSTTTGVRTRATSSARTTGPSRCMPATGGSARWRCCARWCSVSSPTTRPSSSATSS